jgi:Spy/CpxP family protein refolding chaperone
MKASLRTLSLTAAVIASIATFALADGLSAAVPDGTDVSVPTTHQHGAKFKQIREKKMAERAAALGLTDAQQSQIKAIITAARQANAPLRQKLAADRKQVKALSKAVPFDEAAIRSLMASSESIRTDFAVSRIKVRNQIQAVLTPEQQAKAQELRKLDSNRHHTWGDKEL